MEPIPSAAMAGYDIVEIPSLENGRIDLDALKAVVDDTVALMMITNPNTLGLFETDVPEAAEIVHAMAGGQMYYDGANQCYFGTYFAGYDGIRCCAFQSTQNIQPAPRWWRSRFCPTNRR